MSVEVETIVHELIEAFMAKDTARVLALFADDAVMIDPHYPQPAMQGKDAIAAGLNVTFQFVVTPRLTLRKLWQDDESFVAEIDTHHTFVDGTDVEFPQVMVFDLKGDRISRAQVYTPYPPPNLA